MSFVLPFVLSMVVAMALLPLLVRYAGRLQLLDAPAHRKVHLTPIPRVGGIAMAVGVLAAISSAGFSPDMGDAMFLAGATVIFFFGLIDDRYDLDFRLKFLGQIIACGLVVVVGGLEVRALDLPTHVELPRVVGIGLTMFYMVGVTNAVNLSDGLDGLAGGTTFLCLCGLAWLSYVAGQGMALGLCLAFAGAVLGFLRFNTHPAVVFMGDAGSQLLGYAIGGLSLLATQKATTLLSATLPILLLGVPILDTLQVMTRRVLAGHSPFRADRGHLHHRLLALGLEHHEAVMVIYSFQAALLLVAYVERYETDVVVLGTFLAFGGASLLALSLAERAGWKFRTLVPSLRGHGRVTRFIQRSYDTRALLRGAVFALMLSLTAYATLTVYEARAAAIDVRLAVWALTAIMLLQLVIRRGADLGVIDKGVLYAIVAAFVFTDVAIPLGERLIPRLDWALVLLVALSTVVALRSSPSRGFGVTPLDVLILFVTLVEPNLPGLDVLPGFAPLAVAKLVVLCYALEVVLTVPQVGALSVRLAACAAIGALALEFAGVRL